MVHVSGNPTWVDYPSQDTEITAESLENIEGALDTHPRGVVGKHTRTANATAAPGAVETMVLWAEAPVFAGRLYRLIAPNMGVFSAAGSAATAFAQANLRITTDGTVPGVTSTQIAQSVMPLPGAQIGYAFDVTGFYAPESDLTLRAGLSYYGGAGATVTMQGSVAFPIVVTIEDVGPDPGPSGGDL